VSGGIGAANTRLGGPDSGAAFVLDHGGAGQLNRYVYLK